MKALGTLTANRPILKGLLLLIVGLNMSWLNFDSAKSYTTVQLIPDQGSTQLASTTVEGTDLQGQVKAPGKDPNLEEVLGKPSKYAVNHEDGKFDLKVTTVKKKEYVQENDKIVEKEYLEYIFDLGLAPTEAKHCSSCSQQTRRRSSQFSLDNADSLRVLADELANQYVAAMKKEEAAEKRKKAAKKKEERAKKAMEKKKEKLEGQIEICAIVGYELTEKTDKDGNITGYKAKPERFDTRQEQMECRVEKLGNMLPEDKGYQTLFSQVNQALPTYLFSTDQEFAEEMMISLDFAAPNPWYRRDLTNLKRAKDYIVRANQQYLGQRDPTQRQYTQMQMTGFRYQMDQAFKHTAWGSELNSLADDSVNDARRFAMRMRMDAGSFTTTPYMDSSGNGGRGSGGGWSPQLIEECQYDRRLCADNLVLLGQNRPGARGGNLYRYQSGGVPGRGPVTPHTQGQFNGNINGRGGNFAGGNFNRGPQPDPRFNNRNQQGPSYQQQFNQPMQNNGGGINYRPIGT